MIFKRKNAPVSGGMYAEYKREVQPEKTTTSGKVGKMARADIAVTSIVPGCGSTYISSAIANYLFDINRERVTFVGDHKDDYLSSVLRQPIDRQYFPTDITELYSGCDFLVQDLGAYSKLDGSKNMSFARATTKIVVCHADSDSMRKLAAFAHDRSDADRCYYLFNVLPKEWEKNVYRAMDEYEAYCLPLFSAKNPDKDVQMIFKNIFGK